MAQIADQQAMLVVHPPLVSASALAPLVQVDGRSVKPSGALDARTPAIWISNGTGRDGTARRNAPKVGWCWAGNRHTWLGFASAMSRSPLAAAAALPALSTASS